MTRKKGVTDEELEKLIAEASDVMPVRETYYLNNWYRYKQNLKDLNEMQLDSARTLFKGLKELTQEERNFLATKYDRPTIRKGKNKVRPTDDMVAEEIGMTVKKYGNQRRAIQMKLKRIMQEQTKRRSESIGSNQTKGRRTIRGNA